MAVRSAASSMHHHDRLMACAFDGLGSLSMATIDKFRELKAREVEARGARVFLPISLLPDPLVCISARFLGWSPTWLCPMCVWDLPVHVCLRDACAGRV